jgi:hypothetical protein
VDIRATAAIGQIAPSLTELQPNFWVAAAISAVSYPGGVHAALADIEDSSFWFRHRNRVIAETVQRFSGTNPVFEVGGGNGYVSLGLKRAGIPTVVVEPGIDGATIAFERGLTVVNAAFSSDLFENGSLPTIGVFDVVEHIQEDQTFLTDCCTAMVPGGFLYITVPAHQMLWSVDDEYAGHYRRYGQGQLTKVIGAAGFETVQISGFFSLLVPPLFVLRTLPSKLGRRKVVSADQALMHHAEGALSYLIEKALSFEIAAISRGLALPFGTSLLAVARKPQT